MASVPATPNIRTPGFRVVHPLDDVAEQKLSSESLGPIHMTRTVRLSLGVLRAYLLAMTGMLVYHVLHLSGIAPTLR